MMKYWFLLLVGAFLSCTASLPKDTSNTPYRLYDKIAIPNELLTTQDSITFGGDIRMGDLRNNGQADFVVYRAATSIDGGATQPSFLGAFNLAGEVLWQKGTEGYQPNRPGPVAIYDIDADGETEIICLFASDTASVEPFTMRNVHLQILNGADGDIENSILPPGFDQVEGKGPNWVHQRILIANLSGNPTPQDFIIKLGKNIYAFDHHLKLLWTYHNTNDAYQNCPAYIPAVGDIDNDGLDEINGGYFLLDQDGSVLWEKKLGKNMDSVAIDYWDRADKKRAFCSGYGFIMDEKGDTILMLGESVVPHGQELRVADFDEKSPGREMMIRYDGHKTHVMLIAQSGQVIRSFKLNESPNNTGMEAVYWNGSKRPALLYNGGSLWNGLGQRIIHFAELSQPPVGNFRQSWYHAIPCDLLGDDGEDLVLYSPWEKHLFLYTADQPGWEKLKYFRTHERQYNIRLMD